MPKWRKKSRKSKELVSFSCSNHSQRERYANKNITSLPLRIVHKILRVSLALRNEQQLLGKETLFYRYNPAHSRRDNLKENSSES